MSIIKINHNYNFDVNYLSSQCKILHYKNSFLNRLFSGINDYLLKCRQRVIINIVCYQLISETTTVQISFK